MSAAKVQAASEDKDQTDIAQFGGRLSDADVLVKGKVFLETPFPVLANAVDRAPIFFRGSAFCRLGSRDLPYFQRLIHFHISFILVAGLGFRSANAFCNHAFDQNIPEAGSFNKRNFKNVAGLY